jgi:DNA-binding NarL/FixJ family response regulator
MVSGHAGRGYVDKALSAGARGYVLKGDPGEMTVAIREVQSGSTYLSPRLQRVADAPG